MNCQIKRSRRGNYSGSSPIQTDQSSGFDKPIVMLATSPGPGGGNTVLKLAEAAAPFFNGKVVGSLSVPSFFDNFDVDRGELTNSDLVEKLEQVLSAFAFETQPA
ncbi:hypothetical protein [Marinobacter sp. es.042]|uniref:hypothetical protein n=1 Tax=Marinobacter sp. es.042 TaxID=1761794 RepID=UPI0018D4508E|nr:hypothetical protein [Marinobacter sp. es.042]